MTANDDVQDGKPDCGPAKAARQALPPAAARALGEARERRGRGDAALPPELHGRRGLDPVRYGDWEVKDLATDF
jgi:hypothetical protein